MSWVALVATVGYGKGAQMMMELRPYCAYLPEPLKRRGSHPRRCRSRQRDGERVAVPSQRPQM
jgi:hypothetical protein